MSGKIYRIPAAALADAIMREMESSAQHTQATEAPLQVAELAPDFCDCAACRQRLVASTLQAMAQDGTITTGQLAATAAGAGTGAQQTN